MSSSYKDQLHIRRGAEERSAIHQDLGSWMDEMKSKSLVPKPTTGKKHAAAKKNGTTSYSSKSMPSSAEYANGISTSNISSCDEERLRGNKYFTQGQYEEAIQCYTRCLSKKDYLASPLVYSNRGKCSYYSYDAQPAEDCSAELNTNAKAISIVNDSYTDLLY